MLHTRRFVECGVPIRDDGKLPSRLLEYFENPVEMLVLMGRHVARAHHLHSRRDSRTDESVDEDPRVEQVAPELERDHIVSHDDRNNGGLAVDDLEPEFLETRPHLVRIAEQLVDPLRFFLEY